MDSTDLSLVLHQICLRSLYVCSRTLGLMPGPLVQTDLSWHVQGIEENFWHSLFFLWVRNFLSHSRRKNFKNVLVACLFLLNICWSQVEDVSFTILKAVLRASDMAAYNV